MNIYVHIIFMLLQTQNNNYYSLCEVCITGPELEYDISTGMKGITYRELWILKILPTTIESVDIEWHSCSEESEFS